MTLVWSLLKSLIVSIGGDIIKAIWKAFQKPPEVKQAEADIEKVHNNLDAINNNSDGFILPTDAAKDQWGSSITEAGTRMESGKNDGIK